MGENETRIQEGRNDKKGRQRFLEEISMAFVLLFARILTLEKALNKKGLMPEEGEYKEKLEQNIKRVKEVFEKKLEKSREGVYEKMIYLSGGPEGKA